MSEAKTYTVTDIERYHSGNLSAAERHALEKAALNDPFLADALEGYAAAKTPSADLASLQQRLQLRIEKKKARSPVFYLANNWMKIAALFVLVALGGWLIVQMFGGKESVNGVAGTAKEPAKSIAENKLDSVTVPSASERTEPFTPETKREIKKTSIAKNKSVARQAQRQNRREMQPGTLALVAVQDSTKNLRNLARQTAAVAAAKTEAFRKPNAFAKEQNAVAYTDTNKDVNSALKKNDEGLREVVIAKARKQPARQMNVTIDSLEPAEGWTSFNDYVASHLQEPEELKTKNLTGEVELSFEVNADGEPVNIVVSKSLCITCDEEAIRLLKEGPKWKPSKQKGKIKIKFPNAP